MKTIVQHCNSAGEINRKEFDYDDATCEVMAQAVIDLVAETGFCMSEGDVIRIFAKES